MVTDIEKIKEGLHFSFKSLFGKGNNSSLLQRKQDTVELNFEFSGLDCSVSLNDMPILYNIRFYFNNQYLKSFSADFDTKQFPFNQPYDTCCNTQMILHEIVNCKLEGAFRNMFLESKALSLLLCFQKCYLTKQADCTSCKFLTKSIEKDKIVKAKEIILSRLNNPPTIAELAMEIGINQCYLKKGFKELFGTTVYDFIQEQRMLKAKMLLTTAEFSVSQVASEIGFSSASNFSSAFKKFIGVFPKELQQN